MEISNSPVSNQKGFISLILGIIVLLVVAVVGYITLLVAKQTQRIPAISRQSPISSDSTINRNQTPSPSPIISNVPEVKEYKIRFYDTTDIFLWKEKYPNELTGIQDSQLTPIYCTQTYSIDSGYGIGFRSIGKGIPLTDPTLLSYIQSLSKKYEGKIVSEIFSCAPKEGKTIVVYRISPSRYNYSGLPYIGIANNAGEIQEAGKMGDIMAYYGCRQPLQLTDDNNFYFACSGGDGPAGFGSIYKFSLNNLTITRIKRCEYGIDGKTGEEYEDCISF